MEQDEGVGLWLWGKTEGKDVTIWAETTDDVGTWGGVDQVTLVAGRDFTIIADAAAGLLAPAVGPPGARRPRADDRAFLSEGLSIGGAGCLAQFAVDFILVGVGEELVEQMIGSDQFDDAFRGQEWD